MLESHPPTRFRYRRAGGGLLVLGIVSAALLVLARQPEPAAPLAVEATAAGWADESGCVDCHEQASQFWETGHARTLQPATSPYSRELLTKLNEGEGPRQEQTSIRFAADQVLAVTHVDGQETAVELDWCFGSGHHATTWASTMPDSSGAIDELEFRWSLYAGDASGSGVSDASEIVAITPGQPETPPPGRHGKLGIWFDSPKAYRCFSCHASVLPVDDGVMSETELHAGVTCQRCHGPRQEHVLSNGQTSPGTWPIHDRWESVHRCAQCHRRADEFPPEEISTSHQDIVRFQPVGLAQSRCFTESAMDCMTCHDPHKPLAAQDSRGLWQCIQCHNPEEDAHVLCGAGESERCLECHMPAVPMEFPTSFTDHWIRVRKPVAE